MVMENNRKFNLQLFADENGGADPQKDVGTPQSIDYESEYKKMVAERDSYKAEAEKQKGLKDKYASENADYKKKELDKMSDDEKRAREYEELVSSNKKLEAKIKEIETEKGLIGVGFTSEESAKLINAKISIEDVSVLGEIIKSKIEEAVKSAKAELIKETTPATPIGKSSLGGGNESYAERLAKQKFEQGSASDKIKNLYKG